MQGGGDANEPDAGHDAAAYPLDDTLRVNHLQARGNHNSYHVRPDWQNVVEDWERPDGLQNARNRGIVRGLGAGIRWAKNGDSSR